MSGDQKISLESEASDRAFNVSEHVARARESSRSIMGFMTMVAILTVILLPFLSMWRMKQDYNFDDVKELLNIVLPPVAGIGGMVIGFYFGESHRD